MSKPKPIVDRGVIIYYDYEYIFNFLSDEELGLLIRQLLSDRGSPKLNPTSNNSINNAYNYVANRIIDYKATKKLASENGKKGGNPALTLKGTDNPTDKDGVKLKEKKKKRNKKEKEIKIIEPKTLLEEALDEFIKYRKQIKKPLYEHGFKLLVNKLSKMASEDDTKIAILEQTMVNGWVGLYDISAGKGKSKEKTIEEIVNDWG